MEIGGRQVGGKVGAEDLLLDRPWGKAGKLRRASEIDPLALAPRQRLIESGRWWLMPRAAEIDDGEFYAQMKAPTRVRDLSSGQLSYRWTDTGALDHYRHAQAFDHLIGFYREVPRVWVL